MLRINKKTQTTSFSLCLPPFFFSISFKKINQQKSELLQAFTNHFGDPQKANDFLNHFSRIGSIPNASEKEQALRAHLESIPPNLRVLYIHYIQKNQNASNFSTMGFMKQIGLIDKDGQIVETLSKTASSLLRSSL